MTDKYTPGPWITQGDTYVTVNSLIIAHCKQSGHITLDETIANAHLIAAAPDLLAALDAIFNGTGMTGGNMDLARAAIKKAKHEVNHDL